MEHEKIELVVGVAAIVVILSQVIKRTLLPMSVVGMVGRFHYVRKGNGEKIPND